MTSARACALAALRPGRSGRAGPRGGVCGKCAARAFGCGERRGSGPPPSLGSLCWEREGCLVFSLKHRPLRMSFIAHVLKMNLCKFCSGHAFSLGSFRVVLYFCFHTVPWEIPVSPPSLVRFLCGVSSLNPRHPLLFFI